jgi:hypothetical protein
VLLSLTTMASKALTRDQMASLASVNGTELGSVVSEGSGANPGRQAAI